jgi:4-hydroxy-tetrahydrodipicolinate synthase
VGRDLHGCHTASVTPFKGDDGAEVDYAALRELVEFQLAGGVSGMLAVGTTGESPTVTWAEHSEVIARTIEFVAGRACAIAGTGSNSTSESLESTRHAVEHGADAILLVEPYYNGPSSIEIRREYMAPLARAFPDVEIIPYVIPGRTGTQLLPEDVALLAEACPNVNSVKEATGNLDNMRRTRQLCGPDFQILSGDDVLTHTMMADEAIRACGAISVMSNVAPAAVVQLTRAHRDGDGVEAERLANALKPLFDIVTVKTQEDSPHGPRLCKARNPLPVKTLMRVLGMPVGPVRRPLGKLTGAGLQIVLDAARSVWEHDPEILRPIGDAFGIDVERRLSEPHYWQDLCYED